MELEVLLHGINVVEDVIDNPWDDALHGWVVDYPLHGMGLSGRRLSVSKYGSIVSTKNICEKINVKEIQHFYTSSVSEHTFDDVFCSSVIHLILCNIWFKDFVEHIQFSLQNKHLEIKISPPQFQLTESETHWSSEPDGNLMMNLDPVFSSVSLRGRNLQTTLIESSVAASAAAWAWLSLSSPILMMSV